MEREFKTNKKRKERKPVEQLDTMRRWLVKPEGGSPRLVETDEKDAALAPFYLSRPVARLMGTHETVTHACVRIGWRQ